MVFEQFRLPYVVPAKAHNYTPDFVLKNGIVVETKGLFQTEDRQKMKLIKQQHPDIEVRMLFSNAQTKIAKKSPTTYAKWCDTNGYKWAHKDIPKEWLEEPTIERSINALRRLGVKI